MAVAGSTRMQATTSELLVVGAALEIALTVTLRAKLDAGDCDWFQVAAREPVDYARLFAQLLDELGKPEAVAAVGGMVRYEEQVYRHKGLVTYLADDCLLDIFTDTTERSPTFMLPRFRDRDDQVSPPSWAFVKNPLLSTPQAWHSVLRREPRCLAWNVETYRQMGAPAKIQNSPPRLAAEDLLKFTIGREDDPSRRRSPESAAILIALGGQAGRLVEPGNPLRAAFEAWARPPAKRAALVLGPVPSRDLAATVWHVPVRLAKSPLGLWDRLAMKLVLNDVSTATMARMGRLMSNWMVYVEPTNKKLIDRGTRLVAELAGVDYATACHALHETIEELARTVKPGQEKPSPVAISIARLRRRQETHR
jgi:N-acetylmuramic acid 6-phosphate etherase